MDAAGTMNLMAKTCRVKNKSGMMNRFFAPDFFAPDFFATGT
jgi:hypothetical protein